MQLKVSCCCLVISRAQLIFKNIAYTLQLLERHGDGKLPEQILPRHGSDLEAPTTTDGQLGRHVSSIR